MGAKLLLEQTNNIKGLLSGWGLSAKPCDICRTASALLYCRADAAFLCGACDLKIHVASCHDNVTARHERVWMCEVCEQAPAAVTCKADAAVLCTTCDHDIHSANPLAHRHERVPVVPFLDSAVDAAVRSSTTTASSTFLIPDHTATAAIRASVMAPITFDDDGDDAEALLIPNPNSTFLYDESYLVNCSYGSQNLEKLSQKQNEQQISENRNFAFTDTVVPMKTEGNNFLDTSYIDFSQPAKQHNKKNKYNEDNTTTEHQLFSSFDFSAQHSVSSSDIGVVPEGNTNSMTDVSHTFCNSVSSATSGDGGSTAATAAAGLDRVARVLRYREKRKNRKFEKTIRYASRKAYAETRPRIKGRFAKRTGNYETSRSDFDAGSGFLLDQEYGVVPTF